MRLFQFLNRGGRGYPLIVLHPVYLPEGERLLGNQRQLLSKPKYFVYDPTKGSILRTRLDTAALLCSCWSLPEPSGPMRGHMPSRVASMD